MANSAIVGALRVLLSLDSAEFESGMKSASKAATAWQKDLASIGKQATAIGTSLTKALTLPIVGLGVAAVKAASDFESSFAGVRKTVDATEPEFAALAQGLRNMAKEIPTSVNELNAVAEAAGQLGIKKGDILQFTRTMADLGVTTNLTADTAATATAQIQNIFGAAGKDVDRFGATLVALGNAGASTEKDIIEMGLRIAGAGHTVGLTQDQVLSFASALSSVGINAEAGGSAISRVFLKINNAVADGGEDLAEFARVAGMTSAQFKKSFETDAAGATTSFIEGLGKLKISSENINATIEGLVGKNIILKDTLLRASGAGSLLREQLALGAQAWKDNTALTIEAAERYKTFESQLKTLWNQLKDTAITLGTSLLPILKDLVSVLKPVVAAVGQAATVFANLPEPIRLIAVGIAGLVAAIGPVLLIFGQLATGLSTLVGAFAAKGIATRALTALYPPLAAGMLGASAAARTLLVSLGPLAAAITAVWAAWQIGNIEKVKNGIAQWTLSSNTGYAAALRLVLGIEQMTLAEARGATAATASAEAAQKQSVALQQSGLQAAAAAPKVAAIGAASHTAAGQMDEGDKSAKKFADSLKELGGASALAGAKEVVAQLGALNGPLNVMPDKLKQMADRLKEGAQAAILMGNVKLADQYMLLAKTLDPLVIFQMRYNVTIGEYVTRAGMAERATKALWAQFYKLSGMTQTIGPALASSMDLSKLFVPFKAAVKEHGTEGGSTFGVAFKEGLAKDLGNIAQTLSRAFEGGGNWLGAIKSIAAQVGSTLGGAIGSVFGPLGQQIGSAIGSMASMLVNPIKKLFGIGMNDEVKKANTEIEKMMTTLIETHGPLTRLEAKARAVGLSFAEAWGHQGKAGLEAFSKLVTEFEKRLEAVNSKAGGLFDRAMQLPVSLPQGMKDQIQALLDSGGIQGELAEKAKTLLEQQSVNWQKATELADKYGISVAGLGPKFDAAKMHDSAETMINDLSNLIEITGNVGTVLHGARDEMSGLVNEALRTGTELPANMKPWVEELARTGQLFTDDRLKANELANELLKMGDGVPESLRPILQAFMETGELIDGNTGKALTFDELMGMLGTNAPDEVKKLLARLSELDTSLGDTNGKLTNLSELKFGEPVVTQFEDINGQLNDALGTLAEIRNGLVNIPAEVRSRVIIDTYHNDYYRSEGSNSPPEGGGAPAFGGPQAEGGTHFVTKPTWFLAGEAGPEWASFSGALGSLASMSMPQEAMAGMPSGSSSLSGSGVSIDLSGIERRLESVERLLSSFPHAVADAVLLRKGRM